MNILADRELRDLLDRLDAASEALRDVIPEVSAPVLELEAGIAALEAAAVYLSRLREEQAAEAEMPTP